jgi:hypothetical protein
MIRFTARGAWQADFPEKPAALILKWGLGK